MYYILHMIYNIYETSQTAGCSSEAIVWTAGWVFDSDHPHSRLS